MNIAKKVLVCIAVISLSSLSIATYAGTETFYLPKRANQYGYMRLIFIDATNGDQFCAEEGYNEMIGGNIYCGEDESSYVTFDWYQQRWESKSTGSKNQCYPLFGSITCSD